MLGTIITGAIRTGVPILVGSLLTLAVAAGVDLGEQSTAISALLVAVFSTLYYIVARALQSFNPWFGWLLGVPTKPEYSENADEVIVSVIRTVAPAIVGVFLTWLATEWGLDLTQYADAGVALIVAGFSSLYYIVVRAIAQKFPAFEFLLGSKVAPVQYVPDGSA